MLDGRELIRRRGATVEGVLATFVAFPFIVLVATVRVPSVAPLGAPPRGTCPATEVGETPAAAHRQHSPEAGQAPVASERIGGGYWLAGSGCPAADTNPGRDQQHRCCRSTQPHLRSEPMAYQIRRTAAVDHVRASRTFA